MCLSNFISYWSKYYWTMLFDAKIVSRNISRMMCPGNLGLCPQSKPNLTCFSFFLFASLFIFFFSFSSSYDVNEKISVVWMQYQSQQIPFLRFIRSYNQIQILIFWIFEVHKISEFFLFPSENYMLDVEALKWNLKKKENVEIIHCFCYLHILMYIGWL
jgi:hypothetical protein